MSIQITQFNTDYRVRDRRQNTVPVAYERRVNPDRRASAPAFGLNKLKEDVDRFDRKVQQTLLHAMSPIPTARRLSSLPDSIEEDNLARAGLLLGMAAANFPGDFREMRKGGEEFLKILDQGLKDGITKNPYQYEMSFFKGTFLEPVTRKFTWLKRLDKTLLNTGFGEFLQKTFNMGVDFDDMDLVKTTSSKIAMDGYKYTGNIFQQTAARSLHRIPVIGLFASAAIEIPALYKSVTETKGTIFDKAKAFGKQLIKSAGFVGLSTAGIAIGGALLFPYSAILGLVGMGIGSVAALLVSNALNKQVDKLG